MVTAVVYGLFLLPATAAACYYAWLTWVGCFPQRTRPSADPLPNLTVLIPAHDERAGLPMTLASVFTAQYPAELLRVMVIADNCNDDTADVARRGGAEVIERHDPDHRGKGYAVGFGLSHARSSGAVLILDADCTIDSHLLKRVGNELTEAEAVQTAVVSRADATSPGGYVAAVGAAIDHAIAAGTDRLGNGVPLRGTGMAFRRTLLDRCPWVACGVTEDAEYTSTLARHGVRVRFVPDAAVRCDAPDRLGDFLTQRKRWRGALWVTRSGVGTLLASKPLVLAHLLLTVAVTTILTPHLFGWVGLLIALTVGVYGRAMAAVGVPRIGLFARSIGVTARLGWLTLGGFWQREREWQRTPRS